MNSKLFIAAACSLLLSACSETDNEEVNSGRGAGSTGQAEAVTYGRWYQFQHVSEGAKLFKQNCAACHGEQAQGAANWRQRDDKGMLPAPPLNGSGHGWHHPLPILFSVVKNGSPGGQGNMPAWKDKLTDEQILAVIAWFQSKWPEEIYQNWARRDAAARKPKGG